MLTYNEFIELNEDMQTQLLSLEGVCLEVSRNSRKFHIELYSLYGFYCEIYFNKENEEPMYLRSFKNLKNLDPYLESIDVGELLRIMEEGL
ncbi:MAG: hypothetical protein H0U44_00090 [Flavisolibacter sp.]|jgi:hypothetical protein|nr:hypothetical protein [Flavisolibacter sp.]